MVLPAFCVPVGAGNEARAGAVRLSRRIRRDLGAIQRDDADLHQTGAAHDANT